eukprot:jgi/Bigna1/81981/fgenesh1_pg.86_\
MFLPRSVVLGGGAMGSLWAGTLGTVTNVCLYTKWKEHIRKINLQGGIIVQSLDVGRPEIGFVFAKGGVLVSLQNGMGREETLLDAIGSVNRTDKPGIVTHQGSGDTALASAAVLQCEKEAMLWRKLIINCAINPLTAIFGIATACRMGTFFAINPKASGRYQQGLQLIKTTTSCTGEGANILPATTRRLHKNILGVHNAFASEEDAVAAVLRVSEMTQANTSSMLTDILKRKQTEIESINGWVCSMAKRRGCDAPLNQKLCEMIRNIEASQEMNDCLHQLHSEVSTLKHVQELLDVSEPFR